MEDSNILETPMLWTSSQTPLICSWHRSPQNIRILQFFVVYKILFFSWSKVGWSIEITQPFLTLIPWVYNMLYSRIIKKKSKQNFLDNWTIWIRIFWRFRCREQVMSCSPHVYTYLIRIQIFTFSHQSDCFDKKQWHTDYRGS